MIYIIIAICLGIAAGMYIPLNFNISLSIYLSVAIFSALDSLIGAMRANFEEKFDNLIFLSGFILNTIVAVLLAFIGDRLNLPLYYAAIFVFGTRLFSNISIIRRKLIILYREKKKNDIELSKTKQNKQINK